MKDINLIKERNSLYFKKIHSKEQIKNEDCDGYFIDSDEKQIRKIIDSLKTRKKIIIQGKDNIFNRRVLEKMKVNYLISIENHYSKKDTLKQRDSGLNHVLAKISKEKNIPIIINFTEIKNLEKKQKALILSRIIQNIKICRKTGCKIKIASFAEKKQDIVDEHDRKVFLFSLGASSEQVKDCCDF